MHGIICSAITGRKIIMEAPLGAHASTLTRSPDRDPAVRNRHREQACFKLSRDISKCGKGRSTPQLHHCPDTKKTIPALQLRTVHYAKQRETEIMGMLSEM